MSAKSACGLLKQRRFLPLFTLFQAGTFNDNALKQALVAMITYAGFAFLSDLPSAIRVPVATLIFTIPFTLLCAISGQVADKYDRGIIFRWVKRAEVIIMIIAAVGFYFQSIHVLAVALALMGAQSAFFSPTKNAVLPQWLDEKELITGNALMSGFQFAILLVAMVVGLQAPQIGYMTFSIVLFTFALIGWFSAEQCPPAPAPQPNLKVNFEPVTATLSILKVAYQHKNVFRPLLGVAWFYALSTVFIVTLPDYVGVVMGYNAAVLQIVLATSTVSILLGSVIVMIFGNMRIWGPEAVRLTALGICGVALFTLGLILIESPVYMGNAKFGPVSDFFGNSQSRYFLAMIIGSSMCSGMFVVPLQAMAQRRSDPNIRARLMSAGSVLLNLFVNITTFGLLGLAALKVSSKTPFYLIVVGSAIVGVYAVYRSIKLANDVTTSLDER